MIKLFNSPTTLGEVCAKASREFKAQNPSPRICRTVDLYAGLSPQDRERLFMEERRFKNKQLTTT